MTYLETSVRLTKLWWQQRPWYSRGHGGRGISTLVKCAGPAAWQPRCKGTTLCTTGHNARRDGPTCGTVQGPTQTSRNKPTPASLSLSINSRRFDSGLNLERRTRTVSSETLVRFRSKRTQSFAERVEARILGAIERCDHGFQRARPEYSFIPEGVQKSRRPAVNVIVPLRAFRSHTWR